MAEAAQVPAPGPDGVRWYAIPDSAGRPAAIFVQLEDATRVVLVRWDKRAREWIEDGRLVTPIYNGDALPLSEHDARALAVQLGTTTGAALEAWPA